MKQPHHDAGSEARQATPAQSSPAAAMPAPSNDELELRIREAAYFRYLARGAEVGHELEDWLQA